MRRILVVGGHGMLGRPVVRRLVEEGFTIRALARNVDRARELLPEKVQVVRGDLEDVDSIARAAEGMEAVYLNLETPDPDAAFRPDLDGTRSVLEALRDRPNVLVVKIAGFPLRNTEGWWPNSDLKHEAEEIIRTSGHPYLFFHPAWFMESLNLLIRDERAVLFGKSWHPIRWIAGDDYAKMVCAALKQNAKNATYVVQGPEALDFDEALFRFFEARGTEDVAVYHVPMIVAKALGYFSPLAKDMHRLFHLQQTEDLGFEGEKAWEELHEPQMKVEDYYEYMVRCGDVPRKG